MSERSEVIVKYKDSATGGAVAPVAGSQRVALSGRGRYALSIRPSQSRTSEAQRFATSVPVNRKA